MRMSGIQPDVVTFNILMNCHCEMGRVDCAFHVLDEMRTQNLVPNVVSFNTLVKGLCKEGRVEDAFRILREMKDVGPGPDD